MRRKYPIPGYVAEYADTKLPLHCSEILPSMSSPHYASILDADYVKDHDIVVGIVFEGRSRCYPGWIMDNYHVVNDAFDLGHLLVVY